MSFMVKQFSNISFIHRVVKIAKPTVNTVDNYTTTTTVDKLLFFAFIKFIDSRNEQ